MMERGKGEVGRLREENTALLAALLDKREVIDASREPEEKSTEENLKPKRPKRKKTPSERFGKDEADVMRKMAKFLEAFRKSPNCRRASMEARSRPTFIVGISHKRRNQLLKGFLEVCKTSQNSLWRNAGCLSHMPNWCQTFVLFTEGRHVTRQDLTECGVDSRPLGIHTTLRDAAAGVFSNLRAHALKRSSTLALHTSDSRAPPYGSELVSWHQALDQPDSPVGSADTCPEADAFLAGLELARPGTQ